MKIFARNGARNKRRIFGLLFASVLIVFAVGGCYSEPEERLSSRLNRFLDLLNTEEKKNIADGLYDEAAASLAGRVAQDANLSRNYNSLLGAEDIPFFNYKQAIQFFTGSLDGRIRFLRFVKMLEEQELLSFNKGLLSETAQFLFVRFEANPRLAKEYAESIAPNRKRMSEAELVTSFVWAKKLYPFVMLYAGMNDSERKQLIGGEIAQAVRSLAVRRGTDPRVQQTHELIRLILPETMTEYPEKVFEAASLSTIQDQAMRRSLETIAIAANAGKQAGDLLNDAVAFGVVFPAPSERQKRLEDLEGDIAWFMDFVDEKIDFYSN
jgi:hypothetical protein